jgi:amidase
MMRQTVPNVTCISTAIFHHRALHFTQLHANMTKNPVFDILTTDSAELQVLLATGKTASVDIVEALLDQIDKHNAKGLKLNAIISTTPRELALSIAKNLDVERSQGKIRGPLHGIPITIKDNIMTGPEFLMPTTVGSAALRFAMAKKKKCPSC